MTTLPAPTDISVSEQVTSGTQRGDGVTRRGVLIAVALVVCGSLSIQISSWAAIQTFRDLGTPSASAFRMLFAAIILVALFRPSLRGKTASEWRGIIFYGVSMAAMNLSIFAAVQRIPLGIASTIEFLGPCAVALMASRRVWEGLCAVLALAGVALIAGPSGDANIVGLLCAAGAAVSLALYTLSAEKVGKSGGGMGNLALSVSIAAVILLPFGAMKIPVMQPHHVGWLVLSAVCGAVIGYGADTLAAKVTSSRVIGTLFAIDPVTGLIVGWIALGQAISTQSVAGILCVAAAGALLVWISGRKRPEIQ